jgi:preprotein translocase subunit SecA
MDGIKEESVGYLFNLEVQVEQQVEEVPLTDSADGIRLEKAPEDARPEIRAKGLEAPQRPDRLHYTAPSVDGDGGVVEGDFVNGDFDDELDGEGDSDGGTRAERRKAAKGGRRRKK